MEHPERKRIRLKDYDYSQNGGYFVTICTYRWKHILSQIVGDGLRAVPETLLTIIGKEIENSISYMNTNYSNVRIDKYIIMPNHIHLLIEIETGGDRTPPLQNIVGQFKSYTTKLYNNASEKNGLLWHRSFYEHIIRSEQEYLKVWEYIDNNPRKWEVDKYYSP